MMPGQIVVFLGTEQPRWEVIGLFVEDGNKQVELRSNESPPRTKIVAASVLPRLVKTIHA
jgi:hypothetical protein